MQEGRKEGRKEGQTHASCKNVSHAEGNPESDGGSQEVFVEVTRKVIKVAMRIMKVIRRVKQVTNWLCCYQEAIR